jgi:hypothetical protein
MEVADVATTIVVYFKFFLAFSLSSVPIKRLRVLSLSNALTGSKRGVKKFSRKNNEWLTD